MKIYKEKLPATLKIPPPMTYHHKLLQTVEIYQSLTVLTILHFVSGNHIIFHHKIILNAV